MGDTKHPPSLSSILYTIQASGFFGEIKPKKIAKIVKFTLGKSKISKSFPMYLLKNSEILPEEKTQIQAYFWSKCDSVLFCVVGSPPPQIKT